MYRNFIKENVTFVAVVLFVMVFGVIQLIKPRFLYNRDGSIREFGVGYRNKTILPIWLLSLVLGIICYLVTMYYIAYPKINL